MTATSGLTRQSRPINRRQLLAFGAAFTALPIFRSLPLARAAAGHELRFRVLRHGSPVGEHRVAFRKVGDGLAVDTHVDIVVKILFFTAFYLKHDAQEIWQAGRLVSVASATDKDGTRLEVTGKAVPNGFRIVGARGPFLAAADLLSTNSLWDCRIVGESRLIDVHYGGEVGMAARLLGHEQVRTPWGSVRASRYQIITPLYAGSVFYDGDNRWVKALVELRGETLEYVLTT